MAVQGLAVHAGRRAVVRAGAVCTVVLLGVAALNASAMIGHYYRATPPVMPAPALTALANSSGAAPAPASVPSPRMAPAAKVGAISGPSVQRIAKRASSPPPPLVRQKDPVAGGPGGAECLENLERPTASQLADVGVPQHMDFLSEYLCERMDCMRTRGLSVDAVICVHEQAIDVHVSGSIRRSGNWEAHILRPFLALVKRFPQAAVLDLGAQLGQYGLLAARAGARVIFVEASPHNANHIMQSLSQNFGVSNIGLGKRVTLIRNALGRTSGQVFEPTFQPKDNNGGTSWGQNNKKAPVIKAANASSRIYTYDKSAVSITVDELQPLLKDVRDVIIKIDIEGGECNAFAGAMQLFLTKRVRGLFMEFGQLKSKVASEECATMREAIQLIQKNGLRPRDPLRGPLPCCSPEDMRRWSWDVIWSQ